MKGKFLTNLKKNYKQWILYGIIFIICVIGIGVAMNRQFFEEEKIDVILGVSDSDEEDRYNELKNNFNNIFTNDISILQEEPTSIEKIRQDFDIIVNRYTVNEEQESYTIDCVIPNININNEDIKQYNQQIIEKYKQKADEITADDGYIYTVKYKAYLQNNILSLIIYSELKEKTSSQKITLETFNYDINQNKRVSFEEMLNVKNVSTSDAQNKIRDEIKQISDNNKGLIEAGYEMYQRDENSSIYEVSNIEQYFLGQNGYLYVIFPYGNNNQTSEMDIVIFM